MASDYLLTRVVDGFGTKMASGTADVFLGQSFDREIRSVAFQADVDAPDLVMGWDLVQTATDTEAEALLLTGKVEGMRISAPELLYPAAGTPGFQRSLKIVFTETSSGQAAAIDQMVISVQFDEVEVAPKNLGGARANASVLMEKAQSATNIGILEERSGGN